MQTTAQDRAYLHVKNQILSLTLKPGQWIKAQDIATEIKVSRTPVREALSRLEQEGFVRRDEGWGYIVSSVTLKDARELYKMREVLEVEAIREAVSHVTPANLDSLEILLRKADQARKQKKVKMFRENTRAFHATIARLADNALLARMLGELEHRVQFLGGDGVRKTGTTHGRGGRGKQRHSLCIATWRYGAGGSGGAASCASCMGNLSALCGGWGRFLIGHERVGQRQEE